ncbi:Gfo/Idh/MocA family protein [Agromyces silvae]|uniref:Gfo/Idh/MocA family protein n=1 Tax=Agromyces silvae TaxID=3388266 RepID=UPI00280B52BE|nr:Gfo/Idh/MocA family oxidoreductase [Agromyces protaetiae]
MAIRTAIVGYGTAGRVFHAPLIAADPAYELATVVTGSPERAAAAAVAYPGATVVGGADALFARADEFDLVVIGSPNETHAPLALRAIDAGKHVVVDKPVAVTVAEAEAVVERAWARGVVFSVFQNRRWDGDFLTLRDVLASGELGEVRQFESAFEWFAPELGERWKDTAPHAAGGGIAYDLAPHLIDQAVQLFGPVADLHAELDVRRAGGAADDEAFISMRHGSGVRARLWMSAVAPASRPRFRVVGEHGVLTFHGLDPQEPQLIDGVRPGDPGYGRHADGRAAELEGPSGARRIPLAAGDYPAYYRALAAAITEGRPVPVDPADSIAALALIEQVVAGAR